LTLSAIGDVPPDWREVMGPAASEARLSNLDAAVGERRARSEVYPPEDEIFAAFALTPYRSVRAVIIGQDPYHEPGQAHGLAFSVPAGTRIPPSLRNVRIELRNDLGAELPESGSLVRWAEHGVLLLNSVLSVSKGRPRSHQSIGWQDLTTAAIRAIERLDRPVVFLLWGEFARATAGAIDRTRQIVLSSSHPSPLSARRGFNGSRPFSTANRLLRERGATEIDWTMD
jgi:uracil-DNA glycosylase